VQNRRELLRRNLSFGAVIGAGMAGLEVVSTQPEATTKTIMAHAAGGAVGGAVVLVLVSALVRWMIR
jgi:hypothetical protein